jgi:hypothetical protein
VNVPEPVVGAAEEAALDAELLAADSLGEAVPLAELAGLSAEVAADDAADDAAEVAALVALVAAEVEPLEPDELLQALVARATVRMHAATAAEPFRAPAGRRWAWRMM